MAGFKAATNTAEQLHSRQEVLETYADDSHNAAEFSRQTLAASLAQRVRQAFAAGTRSLVSV